MTPVSDPLPSWADGPVRDRILGWVAAVTEEGGTGFVPPPARVAVFDNDGTLWCERPTYPQAFFLLERLREMADADPDLAARPLVRALLSGDLDAAIEEGIGAVTELVLRTHAGLTAEEFTEVVASWLDDAVHPRFGVPFTRLVYAPMIELLELLGAHGFRRFIVTGGGVEFVRAFSDAAYAIPTDDVIGSAVDLSFRRHGTAVDLVREPSLFGSPNEGAPKALNIQYHVGRRPIFAAGNSAGDREMLEYATGGPSPSLAVVIEHDDEEREYRYQGSALTAPGAEPIATTAAERGWTAVSMRHDWLRVFAEAVGG